MKFLSAIGSTILFGALALLSFVFAYIVFSPSAVGPWAMLYLYPTAVVGVIIGVVAYRLWRDRLFWMLLIISALAFFAGTRPQWRDLGDVRSALITTLLFAPVFAVPLWQFSIVAAWGARTLKGEGRIPK